MTDIVLGGGGGRVKVISVEIRLILVISVSWTVVGGCYVCGRYVWRGSL